MSEILDFEKPQPKLDTAGKRALIEKELQENPNRSDREIARALGKIVDHKTIAARRREMGLASSSGTGNVTGLIASTLASNGLDPSDPTLFPILTAAANRDTKKFNPFDPKDDCLIAQERLGLAVFVNTRNNVVIANGNERDGIDEMVQVSPVDLDALIGKLRDIKSEFDDGAYSPEGDDND